MWAPSELFLKMLLWSTARLRGYFGSATLCIALPLQAEIGVVRCTPIQAWAARTRRGAGRDGRRVLLGELDSNL